LKHPPLISGRENVHVVWGLGKTQEATHRVARHNHHIISDKESTWCKLHACWKQQR